MNVYFHPRGGESVKAFAPEDKSEGYRCQACGMLILTGRR
jgi:hypothetical protein